MLEIQSKPRRRGVPKSVFWGMVIVLLLGGCYILIVVLAPGTNEPLLTGRDQHATEQKLQKPIAGDRLFIPQINVDVAIVEGSDSRALEKGAWHRKPQNGNPLDGGNFVLSAHRFVMTFTPQGTAEKSPFYRLDTIKVGDQLVVDYHSKRYFYQVAKKYSVKPNAIEIEKRSEQPKLTLYSCTLEGSTDGREVIEATPLTGRKVTLDL